MSTWTLITISIVAWMSALWAWSVYKGRFLLADFGWVVSISISLAILAYTNMPLSPWVSTWLVLQSIWAIRLAWTLWKRYASGHEDKRYQNLADHWPTHRNAKFYGFFMAQGLLAIAFAAPFAPIFDASINHKGWLLAGAILFILGLCMETLADLQVERFKKRNHDPNAFCKEGLWAWSQNPNYFFEWVAWIGLAVYATGFEHGYWAWLTVGLEYIFLRYFSGIPLKAKHMRETRGEAYKEYQQQTPVFIPRPKV